MTNNLLKKLKKTSTIKYTHIVSEDKTLLDKKKTKMNQPFFNIALSGELDGGLTSGNTMIAGPSRHFKTLLGYLVVKSYLDEHPNSILVLYNSEFGSPIDYFTSVGIPEDRVIVKNITDVEELKFDMIKMIDINRGELDDEDDIIMMIDSTGNLASVKEVEDAHDEKSVADMSRAKAFKSFFRIVTPHLSLRDIPLVLINHTYENIMGMGSAQVVSGGTGGIYNADTIWVIGKSMDKKGTELVGNNFTLNIEKSRFVKEKMKLKFNVPFDKPFNKWTGLFDIAVDGGFIIQSGAWYTVESFYGETKKRRNDIEYDNDFWEQLTNDQKFKDYVKSTYKLSQNLSVDNDKEETEIES